jgi:GAF domain-containing protein
MEFLPLTGSISGLVSNLRKSVNFDIGTLTDDPDLGVDERAKVATDFGNSGMLAWVAVPLQYQGEVISVLHVQTSQKDRFDQDDLALIEDVASRVASAVASSRLHEAAKNYARKQGLLAQISREIGSSLETSETFDAFTIVMTELVPVDRVSISNVDVSNQTAETLYVSWADKFTGVEARSYRTTGTATGHAYDIGETVVINDPSTVARRFEDWKDNEGGLNSSVTVPLG